MLALFMIKLPPARKSGACGERCSVTRANKHSFSDEISSPNSSTVGKVHAIKIGCFMHLLGILIARRNWALYSLKQMHNITVQPTLGSY